MRLRKAQVAIVALLISVLVMTIGLSLSKRTTIETTIDTNEESLRDAFNTAESGIDYYLKTGGNQYIVPSMPAAKADISSQNIGGGNSLDFGEYVSAGSSETYWLVNHNSDGSLGTSYYSGTNITVNVGNFDGALEAVYFYRSGSKYYVKRFGYNFSNDSAKMVTGFEDKTGSSTVINISPSQPIMIALRPIFDGGNFRIEGSSPFPPQGKEISSTGKVGEVSSGQVNKKVMFKSATGSPLFCWMPWEHKERYWHNEIIPLYWMYESNDWG